MPRYLVAIYPYDNYDPFSETEATKCAVQQRAASDLL